MPWLSHTFLLVHPKYHVEKLSITSHRAGKCAALETFYDKSLWKSCSLVVKALMCANNWLTTVSFLWRSKLCTLWCCVMSSKKANLSDIWQSVRAVKFPSSEKKGKEKKKLQCGSPTEPPHSFVIYSIFIFSLNVKQDLRKLGVVHGFGKIEINGLHPTFHNIIKSEMFWTENLLLDYKVSLILHWLCCRQQQASLLLRLCHDQHFSEKSVTEQCQIHLYFHRRLMKNNQNHNPCTPVVV